MPLMPALRRVVRRVPGYRYVQALRQAMRRGDDRTAGLLRLRRPAGLFQPFGTTFPNRYPVIFACLAERLASTPGCALLSFGCSTGEEVFALGDYLPRATIKGIDIAPGRIALCRERLPAAEAHRITFAVASSTADEPTAHYDAVLAMAVFRSGERDENPPAREMAAQFARFEMAVADLARCVKPGGYLVIRHASFRFADTAGAAAFEPMLERDCITARYDRAGGRIVDQPMEDVLFRKNPA